MTTICTPIPLSRIRRRAVERISTCFHELDWVFGSSQADNASWQWGLPLGAVSLWAGAAGSGKSRLGITVAASISTSGIQAKNRYGVSGRAAAFVHDNDGLSPVCVFEDVIGTHQLALNSKTGQEWPLGTSALTAFLDGFKCFDCLVYTCYLFREIRRPQSSQSHF